MKVRDVVVNEHGVRAVVRGIRDGQLLLQSLLVDGSASYHAFESPMEHWATTGDEHPSGFDQIVITHDFVTLQRFGIAVTELQTHELSDGMVYVRLP